MLLAHEAEVLSAVSTLYWEDTAAICRTVHARRKTNGHRPGFFSILLAFLLRDPEIAGDATGVVIGTLPGLVEQGLVEIRHVPRTGLLRSDKYPYKSEYRRTATGTKELNDAHLRPASQPGVVPLPSPS